MSVESCRGGPRHRAKHITRRRWARGRRVSKDGQRRGSWGWLGGHTPFRNPESPEGVGWIAIPCDGFLYHAPRKTGQYPGANIEIRTSGDSSVTRSKESCWEEHPKEARHRPRGLAAGVREETRTGPREGRQDGRASRCERKVGSLHAITHQVAPGRASIQSHPLSQAHPAMVAPRPSLCVPPLHLRSSCGGFPSVDTLRAGPQCISLGLRP